MDLFNGFLYGLIISYDSIIIQRVWLASDTCTAEAFLYTVVYILCICFIFLFLLKLARLRVRVCLGNNPVFVKI